MVNLDDARQALHKYFGYESFRPGQEGLVSAILEGRDCLGVMPTGAGKSICYQIPATLLPGLTVVISPLVSLMKDQVDALEDAGIHADFINSTQTPEEQSLALAQAAQGRCHMLYVAPERLDAPRFVDFASRAGIGLVAVDEAHCVSQWGQDFRPAYLGIGDFIKGLPDRPVVAAFTATATQKVRRDIVAMLGLKTPYVAVTGFDRPNLFFDVRKLQTKYKNGWITRYAHEHPGDSGIVYCATRKETEALADDLNRSGIGAAAYHAGLSADDRERAQRDFVNDEIQVVVATNAFGMGIDKSNVRYVIHHNMPESIEAYYQEAGRAGRDGEPARCTLLWNEGDIVTRRRLLDMDSGNDRLTGEQAEAVRAEHRRLLNVMIGYCRTTGCLHEYMLRYFGQEVDRAAAGLAPTEADRGAVVCVGHPDMENGEEEEDQGEAPAQAGSQGRSRSGRSAAGCGPEEPTAEGRGCGNCSNCMSTFETLDVSDVARAVSRCVHDVNQAFGSGKIVQILKGSRSQDLLRRGLDGCPSYGSLAQVPEGRIRDVLNQMASDGYLTITEGRLPMVHFGPLAGRTVTPDFHYEIKRVQGTVLSGEGGRPADDAGAVYGRTTGPASQAEGRDRAGETMSVEDLTGDQAVLFQELKDLRTRIAREIGKPPYIVFSDKSLRDMCRLKPTDDAAFLEVNGVGEHKLEVYGPRFMEVIRKS
ncbi:RecQ family ATP-dependent DNA helicase [Bifidobacterium favimelis]|uniref:ATP-dependent DNA helicase RecQ n=1 Tax=Bifidobacterium favimelis TaxID=3122979 RepID=A0ABU8ZNC2_9BIFI